MSAGTPAVKRLFKRKLSPRGVSLLIVLFVVTCALTARHLGWFQSLEFHAYDFFLRHQPKADTSDPIVIVEMTEADIHNPLLDWPIYDDRLAELLGKLVSAKPAVIGLDIWRDIPVPKHGVGIHDFNQVLLSNANIIPIFTLGGIAPPEVLKGNPDRIAFNDNFPVDVKVNTNLPVVRRSMLFGTSHSGENYYSLPFRLAMIYLERKGIQPELDPADAKVLRLGKARLRQFQANDGAYVGADAAGWHMLLDFKCPDRFTRYSVSDALSGGIPPEILRDNIVLIGVNTQSVFDERVTPINRRHLGVEVQAMTINQLLRHALEGEKPLQYWNDWTEDVWVVLWCLVGGSLGYKVRSPWRFGPESVAALFVIGGFAWVAFSHGWWIPLAAPAIAYAPAAVLVTSYVSYQEKKQRGQLMQLFSRQVSPDIAQALWEQREEFLAGQRPRSQKLTATVLFTDLVAFTSTSEKMEPDLLMDWLNEYMEAMATVIMAHQGVVEKYIGDAIMAVFGVPLARTSEEEITQDARNAVRCALAMRLKIGELNAQWKERGLPVSGMRVGIHTGPLVAGSLGSSERQEYTVIGDSVNTASRLESFSLALPGPESPDTGSRCRILISEATRRLLGDEFQTREVGDMILKNKKAPVTIYAVITEQTGGSAKMICKNDLEKQE
jgi:adenylate cyclase